ncbi:ABC transporter ATP-binding protein [Halorussus salilacus]|uniref:ABC transporter ATP-binding protein n=1 Tax=Halorussus salilacus TaxID=2953750 RepID=UPI00209D4C2D|nr:ABC transporter ATP-binding protein [Halorussus salilacus]USZ67352.1 ABC transporter ATP-binding protein [Halorussus salilacus]
MTAAIEVENLRKRYDGVQALDGVSLTVPEGSFFGLLGPNGAGKTTFINILVGLVRRTGGRAEVFGYDVRDDYQRARDLIGLAPQEFNVDRFFPIREVLTHKAGYHGIPESEAEARADEVLRRVGIYDKRDTRFNWLSGGMKRRFMLARALITDPDLLILDEPTAGVDVQLRHDLWDLITELNESGTTVLLTTHYIEEAERLCDEVAILDSGNLLTVATPEELMDRGPDRITVTLRDPPARAPDLSGLGDGDHEGRVEAVEVEGDRLVVTARKGGLVAPDLVRELDRAGHEIVDLDISRTSLEEVFVEMTREGASEQGGDSDDGDESDADRVAAATDGGEDATHGVPAADCGGNADAPGGDPR